MQGVNDRHKVYPCLSGCERGVSLVCRAPRKNMKMPEHESSHVEPLKKPLDRKALALAEVAFLTVTGMGCPNCAARVRNALLRLEGVLYADISLTRGTAAVAFKPEQVATRDLITAMAGAGSETGHCYLIQLLQTLPAREAFTFVA